MSKRFIVYSLYAWVVPALIVGSALSLDLTLSPSDDEEFASSWTSAYSWAPRYGDRYCWITSRTALLTFFALPLGLVLITNVVLFVVSICYIQKASKASQPAVKSKSTGRLFLYAKLSFVMGLSWVFGFVASIYDWTVFWYMFVIFNSLQGAFICLSFVCTAKVFRLLKNGNCSSGYTPPSSSNNTRINNRNNVCGRYTNVNVTTKETTAGTNGSDSGRIVSKETAMWLAMPPKLVRGKKHMNGIVCDMQKLDRYRVKHRPACSVVREFIIGRETCV